MLCTSCLFHSSEDSGKTDSDLDDSWVMTVKGPNSFKTSPELNTFSPEWLSKKTHQNGSLHSKKSSQQKSNVEPSVSLKSHIFQRINCYKKRI